MGKADLHIHTTCSPDGTATVAAVLEHVASIGDLDVIAITDHDVIDGALEAMELAPHYGVEVVPGVEVTTADGHLLALYVTSPIPTGRPLIESIEAVAAQGGLCVAAHPGGWWEWCLQEPDLQNALAQPGIANTLVGLEEYNASLPFLSTNRRASGMNKRLKLSQVYNSDAHLLSMIGNSATHFPGKSAFDLRQSLLARTTRGYRAQRPINFYARYLWRQALRTCGWVQTSPITPGTAIRLSRLHRERFASTVNQFADALMTKNAELSG